MNLNEVIALFNKSDPSEWHVVYFQDGKAVAYLQTDVDLRIETSSDEEHCQNNDFQEEWANNFPDPRAFGRFYDLYYRSTIIARFVLVFVDGARASLPLPDPSSKVAPQSAYKVAQIFNHSSSDLERYMRNAGLTVSPIPDLLP